MSQLDIHTRKWNLTSRLTFYLYLRINKVWNVHTMKYYSVMKMNDTTWENLKHDVKNFGYRKTKIWLFIQNSEHEKLKIYCSEMQTYVLKLKKWRTDKCRSKKDGYLWEKRRWGKAHKALTDNSMLFFFLNKVVGNWYFLYSDYSFVSIQELIEM